MDRNALEGKRPAWWKGKDGGVPLMPKSMPKYCVSGHHSFSGKEMEEMVWNRCYNTNWSGKDADLYVGGGNCTAQKRMQAWDHHKRLWQGSVRSQMSEFCFESNQKRWWRRYHEFVDNGGDATPHPRILELYGTYERHKGGAITALCA